MPKFPPSRRDPVLRAPTPRFAGSLWSEHGADAMISSKLDQARSWVDEHKLQSNLSQALVAAINTKPENPTLFIGEWLIALAKGEPLPGKNSDSTSSEEHPAASNPPTADEPPAVIEPPAAAEPPAIAQPPSVAEPPPAAIEESAPAETIEETAPEPPAPLEEAQAQEPPAGEAATEEAAAEEVAAEQAAEADEI